MGPGKQEKWNKIILTSLCCLKTTTRPLVLLRSQQGGPVRLRFYLGNWYWFLVCCQNVGRKRFFPVPIFMAAKQCACSGTQGWEWLGAVLTLTCLGEQDNYFQLQLSQVSLGAVGLLAGARDKAHSSVGRSPKDLSLLFLAKLRSRSCQVNLLVVLLCCGCLPRENWLGLQMGCEAAITLGSSSWSWVSLELAT